MPTGFSCITVTNLRTSRFIFTKAYINTLNAVLVMQVAVQ